MVNSTTGAAILRPEQVGELLIKPVQDLSVAMRVSNTVDTANRTYRIPVVEADPTVAWVEEGAEIALSDPSLSELKITPSKVAGITVISAELANDSSPEAAETVGDGLARKISRNVDAAYFGTVAAPAPSGLPSLVGIGEVDGDYTSVDWAADAISQAQEVGATITSFVANPATARRIATIKIATNYAQPLLGIDPSQPTKRTVQGVTLEVCPNVADDVVWALPQDRAFVVVRQDAEIATSTDALFTSDRVAIRGIMRVGFGFPHPEAVQKVTLTPPTP